MAENEVRQGENEGKGEAEETRTSGQIEEAAMAEMADAIHESIVEPLGLLAGAFSSMDEDASLDPKTVGSLLGLIVRGARAELHIHREGGYPVKYLNELLGEPMRAPV
jgi:hypothetical protein